MKHPVKTKPQVFIIESLSFDDEEANRYEGKFLSQILNLNEKESIYYYIRTKAELEEIIDKFDESGFRYLHISCHASPNSLATTLDSISFKELAEILNPVLKNKRIFLSACSLVNNRLADTIIKDSGCYSIVGPHEPINFSDAAIFWASFYHLMFAENESSMKMSDIQDNLNQLSSLFKVPISYYKSSKQTKSGYRFRRINPKPSA